MVSAAQGPASSHFGCVLTGDDLAKLHVFGESRLGSW